MVVLTTSSRSTIYWVLISTKPKAIWLFAPAEEGNSSPEKSPFPLTVRSGLSWSSPFPVGRLRVTECGRMPSSRGAAIRPTLVGLLVRLLAWLCPPGSAKPSEHRPLPARPSRRGPGRHDTPPVDPDGYRKRRSQRQSPIHAGGSAGSVPRGIRLPADLRGGDNGLPRHGNGPRHWPARIDGRAPQSSAPDPSIESQPRRFEPG